MAGSRDEEVLCCGRGAGRERREVSGWKDGDDDDDDDDDIDNVHLSYLIQSNSI